MRLALPLVLVALPLQAAAVAGDSSPPQLARVVQLDAETNSDPVTRAAIDATGTVAYVVVARGLAGGGLRWEPVWQSAARDGSKSQLVAIPVPAVASSSPALLLDAAFADEGTTWVAWSAGRPLLAMVRPDGTTAGAVDLDPGTPPGTNASLAAVAVRGASVRAAFVRWKTYVSGVHLLVRSVGSDLALAGDPVEVSQQFYAGPPNAFPDLPLPMAGPSIRIAPDGRAAVVFQEATVDPSAPGIPVDVTARIAFVDSSGAVSGTRAVCGPVTGSDAFVATTTTLLDDGTAWVACSYNDSSDGSGARRVGLARVDPAVASAVQAAGVRLPKHVSYASGPILLATDAAGAAYTVEDCPLNCALFDEGRPVPSSLWWRRTSPDASVTVRRSLRIDGMGPSALAVAPDGTSLVAASQSRRGGRSRLVVIALSPTGRVLRRMNLPWAYDVGAPVLVAGPGGGPTRFVAVWSQRAASSGALRTFVAFFE